MKVSKGYRPAYKEGCDCSHGCDDCRQFKQWGLKAELPCGTVVSYCFMTRTWNVKYPPTKNDWGKLPGDDNHEGGHSASGMNLPQFVGQYGRIAASVYMAFVDFDVSFESRSLPKQPRFGEGRKVRKLKNGTYVAELCYEGLRGRAFARTHHETWSDAAMAVGELQVPEWGDGYVPSGEYHEPEKHQEFTVTTTCGCGEQSMEGSDQCIDCWAEDQGKGRPVSAGDIRYKMCAKTTARERATMSRKADLKHQVKDMDREQVDKLKRLFGGES